MAITLVVNTAVGSPDGNNVTTSGVDTTGANLLVVVCSDSVFAAARGISDSKGNTWNSLTARLGSAIRVRIHYAWNATVGTGHTFSTTGAGLAYPAIAILAFAGVRTASTPFDQENGAAPGTTGTSQQTGSVTPIENNEVLVAGVSFDPGSTETINGGFTISNQVNVVASANEGVGAAYLIQTTLAAANPTWSGSSVERATAIATFRAAATGGAVQPSLMLLGAGS